MVTYVICMENKMSAKDECDRNHNILNLFYIFVNFILKKTGRISSIGRSLSSSITKQAMATIPLMKGKSDDGSPFFKTVRNKTSEASVIQLQDP